MSKNDRNIAQWLKSKNRPKSNERRAYEKVDDGSLS